MNDIPALSTTQRYDVKLFNKEADKTCADVAWGINVDRIRAAEIVLELLIMREKRPDVFTGEIVISSVPPEDKGDRFEACLSGDSEEDRAGRGDGKLRLVRVPGTDIAECGHHYEDTPTGVVGRDPDYYARRHHEEVEELLRQKRIDDEVAWKQELLYDAPKEDVVGPYLPTREPYMYRSDPPAVPFMHRGEYHPSFPPGLLHMPPHDLDVGDLAGFIEEPSTYDPKAELAKQEEFRRIQAMGPWRVWLRRYTGI